MTIKTLGDAEDAISEVQNKLREIAYFLQHIEYDPRIIAKIDGALLTMNKVKRQVG